MSQFEQFQDLNRFEEEAQQSALEEDVVADEIGSSERISEAFLDFQTIRLSHSLEILASHVDAGSVNSEAYDQMKKLVVQLEGIATL